jgi:hypothetical protein
MNLTKEKREKLEQRLQEWSKIAQTGHWMPPTCKKPEDEDEELAAISRFLHSPECVEDRKYYAKQMIKRIKTLLKQ